MNDIDSKITNKGRALNVMSVGIITYVWSEASFTEEGILGGGMVRFGDPDVLERVSIILFVYFIVRFLTPWERNPLNRTINSAKAYIHADRAHQKKVKRLGEEAQPNREVHYLGRKGDSKKFTGVWRADGEWRSIVKYRRPENPNIWDETIVSVPGKFLVGPWTRALLRTALFQDTFREDVVPVVLATIATICIVGRTWFCW